jgi:hypothetical protein
MIEIQNLETVETVYEVVEGEYVYRFHCTDGNVQVRRTKQSNGLQWSHGVLVEVVDEKTNTFRPSNVVHRIVTYRNLPLAVLAVNRITGAISTQA